MRGGKKGGRERGGGGVVRSDQVKDDINQRRAELTAQVGKQAINQTSPNRNRKREGQGESVLLELTNRDPAGSLGVE